MHIAISLLVLYDKKFDQSVVVLSVACVSRVAAVVAACN